VNTFPPDPRLIDGIHDSTICDLRFPMTDAPFISVVIPCYNEEKYIPSLMENLRSQVYPPEQTELIFADGMSQDRTRSLLEEFARRSSQVLVIDNPGQYVSTGLNAAIKASKGSIIIRMDAHSIYPLDYWKALVDKLVEHQADNVGGVWDTQPGADTDEAQAIVLATSHPLGIGNADYRLGGGQDTEADTVPFGCFRRDVFDRLGYFDPQLVRNQDDEFNGRILKNGGKIMLIPTIRIKYFARESRRKLARMFYQYGLFKPLVNIKLGSPATLRQFAPPVFVMSLVLLMIPALWLPLFAMLFSLEILLYGSAIIVTSCALARGRGLSLFWHTLLTFPVIHFSYGIGYLAGIVRFVILRQHRRNLRESVKSNR